jgi:hypothetical protein
MGSHKNTICLWLMKMDKIDIATIEAAFTVHSGDA